jgi:hypothetical protein
MAKKKSSAAPLLIVGVGAVIVAAVALSSRTASAAEPPAVEPPDTSSPEAIYQTAMRSDVTDPSVVQSYADWLNQANRPDLAATVNGKANALRAEAILREALSPDVVATTEELGEWARDLGTIPDYLAAVQSRAAAQQGMIPTPSRRSIELLSGTGTLIVDYAAFAPTPSVAAQASPPVVVAPPAPVTPPPAPVAPPPAPVLPANAAPVVLPPPAPNVAPVPEISTAETTPQADPNGTIALARALISEEGQSGWKHVSDSVKAWQGRLGLKQDGQLGPKSVQRMASEVAILPLVRYWALNSKPLATQLANHRDALFTMAESKKLDGDTVWASGLIASAEREQGQGWPKSPSTVVLDVPSPDELETIEENLDAILAKGPSNG